ncbi:MAG: acyl-CoA dehydrogenase family protein [Thermoplasmatales archaeon]|nr:acyl-CoA dehydrogenase family protein [Thermoplasmatales archaeon]MCW6170655.1 acyl-CoA dehydrogenase family protein [Thermoplasmatales archaeon]
MDFNLPNDVFSIKELTEEFSKREIEPNAKKIEKEPTMVKDILTKMGKFGLLGITIPEKFGGAGLDYLTFGVIVEEIAYHSASLALSYGGHSNLVLDNIYRNGTEGQREEFARKLALGEWIGSLCLTEPGAGSDAIGGMTTSYRKTGNRFIINGSKMFITNAPIADVFLVYARESSNYSAFILRREDGVQTPGLIDKMGMRGSPTGEVVFRDVEVDRDRILGEEGGGKRVIYEGLNAERATMAFLPLGIARRAMDEAVVYAKKRKQFGKPISDYQLIQEKIAYMFTRLEAAKLLAYKAIILAQDKVSDPKYAAASIMLASETAIQIAKDAVQILGGYGYTTDFPVERLLRDSVIGEIAAGTTEIRKLVIARSVIESYKDEMTK